MRRLLLTLVVLAACSSPDPEPAEQPRAPSAPIADLQFNDYELQKVATHLRRKAELQGIHTSPGRNRVERLLALEASLGVSNLAFNRVSELAARMTVTDVSQWAKLRQRAERDFANRDDETARRVRDLLARWQRRKSEEVYAYLSSNYESTYITSLEWERRFHAFVTERPMDAATWGWLLLREHPEDARGQYGRADAESAYRFYLEYSGLGDGREARLIFSVPGVEIR